MGDKKVKKVKKVWPSELRMVDISEVEMLPGNPRVGNIPKIRESIKAHGFMDPIVVQKSTMQVLAGNHRLLVAKELGYTEVPARVVDIPDGPARRYVLAANKASDEAAYDEETLANLLADIMDEGEDALVGTAYSAKEAEAIVARAAWQDEGDLEIPEDVVETHKGVEATGTHKGPKPQDRTKTLEALQRRSLILSIPVSKHAILVAALQAARDSFDVNTNEEMIVEMLKVGGFLKKKFRIFEDGS